ncbi:carbohydrate-binding protein [Marinimicrobium sp. ABcell2]|uniref:carbohydrate-binding protein n=1 Tax=Marinimicrobium sp. ABcell2 TaxID=3069751 RepID=UPI0027B4B935|nr:family 16 glycosylhydrolase [Marinimicrobium sp. ABcell2]MDQ2077056.1 family 16 glycosylhydrolase [Marinimicrobium sp. ABcell2]
MRIIKRLSKTALCVLLFFGSTAANAQSENLALGASAWASTEDLPASNAVDGNGNTRWASAAQTDPSYLVVDLGQAYELSSVVIHWEAANAETYHIHGSNNGSDWVTLATESGGTFGDRTDNISVAGSHRYVRMYGVSRSAGNEWGYSIWEFEVYGTASNGGGSPETITLQAQDYVNYHDTTPFNQGGQYRDDGVDIEICTDVSGDYNVGWTEAGEWLEYPIDLQGGTYTIQSRVASAVGGGAFTVDLNGSEIVGTQNVANTGGWQNWITLESDPIELPAGTHTVRVNVISGGFNLNWLQFDSDGSGNGGDPTPGLQLVWSDEFDTIDHNNWTFETGNGDWGWGNGELQYYTDGDNAFIQYDPEVNSNVLVLEARQENPHNYQCHYGLCQYTSTRMKSLGKQEFTYGRMEARIKLPTTQGIWPAFWMMGNDFEQVGWPYNGELDIMEHVGFEPHMSHGALHGPGYSGDTPINGSHNFGEPADARYRVYAVEWDENGISWFVDDHNFYSVTKAEVEQYGTWVYDHPFFFIFNVAVGGTWPGDPDGSSSFPQRMYVDYVRVYQ